MTAMNDLVHDWKGWSRIEQAAVTLTAVVSLLVVAIGLA
jgi:hypothetical protein